LRENEATWTVVTNKFGVEKSMYWRGRYGVDNVWPWVNPAPYHMLVPW